MISIKKALILSLGLHLVVIFGGGFFLKRIRLKNKKIIYPIRLIEIAESSPKPVVRPPEKEKSKPTPPQKEKQKTKVVNKKVPPKPLEPKKGVPIKEEVKKKKTPKKELVKQDEKKTEKSEIKKNEEKKVNQAIEEIKKSLAQKEKTKHSQVSKKFIDRQLQDYAAKIYSLIKIKWSIPKAFSKDMGDLEAIVIIRIKSNGELADARLEKPSGFHPFDESILRAVKKAAPFPPPPLDLREDGQEIEIGFHSNQMG